MKKKIVDYDRLVELYQYDSNKFNELKNSYLYIEVENQYIENSEIIHFVENKNNPTDITDQLYICNNLDYQNDKDKIKKIIKLNSEIKILNDFIKYFFKITIDMSMTEKVNKIKEKNISAENLKNDIEKYNCFHEPFFEILLSLEEIKEAYPENKEKFIDRTNWIKSEEILKEHLTKLKNYEIPQLKYKFIEDVLNGYEIPIILHDENKAVISLFVFWYENEFINYFYKEKSEVKTLNYSMVTKSFKKENGDWIRSSLENARDSVIIKSNRERINLFKRILL